MHDFFVEFGRCIVDDEVFFFDDVFCMFAQELVQLRASESAIWAEVQQKKDSAS